MKQNPRLIATHIIFSVIEQGTSLTKALDISCDQKPLIQQLCFGTCRHYFELNHIVQQLLEKPLKQKDKLLHYLLLVGIYQLRYLDIPPHAAVAETVNCVKALGKTWAKGFINGVLRNYQRQKKTFEQIEELTAYYNHPAWLIAQLQQAWPEQWQQILKANNQHPPMSLRVNQQQISTTDYLALLEKENLPAQQHPNLDSAIILEKPCTVKTLPGFEQGHVSVQDVAAQYCAMLLDLQPKQRVLDACSAPGGKACHMLELQPSLQLTAIDIEAKRCEKILENLHRLQLEAQVITADALDLEQWWDQKPYHRILLDAPCSATGVIRRHPDIKLLRRAEDIEALAETQLTLLKKLWPLLKPQGKLLYSTCSVMPQENDTVIKQFIHEYPETDILPLSLTSGHKTQYGWQLLPGDNQMDGFYFCLLCKAK